MNGRSNPRNGHKWPPRLTGVHARVSLPRPFKAGALTYTDNRLMTLTPTNAGCVMQDTPNTPNTSDTDTPTSEILSASERAAIDGLLRWQLGRRMTVCLLALVDTHGDEAAALSRRLASVEEIAVTPPAASAEGGLNQAARTDAEVTLVWLADDA